MRRTHLPAALALLLAACSVGIEGAPCQTDASCPEGQGCGADLHCASGARCPAAGPAEGQGCSAASALACPGTVRLRCSAVASLAACNVWVRQEDCGAAGLVCRSDATACVCPPGGPIFYADTGAPAPPTGLVRTGALAPSSCRFDKFGDALSAANAVGAGGGVRLVGFTAGQMVFTEAGPFIVAPGVGISTDDPGAVPTRYALAAASGATAPFLTLHAGTALADVEIQNASSGDAIATACPAPTDTAPVTIDKVKVTGSSGSRAGIHHGGRCALVVNAATLAGSGDSGLFVEAAAGALTVAGTTITNNSATTGYTLGLNEHRGGGIVFTAPLPPSVVFTGNHVFGNGWDQILVAASSTGAALNLRGGTALGDCATTGNVICRSKATPPASVLPFVGVFSNGAPVQVDWNQWTQQPGVPGTDIGGSGVAGYNNSCPVIFTCP